MGPRAGARPVAMARLAPGECPDSEIGRRCDRGTGIFCTTDPPAAQTLPFDAAGLATAPATGQDAFYFWRITRPFATRLGALATRLAIGTASLTGGSVVGLGSTTTAGTALSFLATSGVVW